MPDQPTLNHLLILRAELNILLIDLCHLLNTKPSRNAIFAASLFDQLDDIRLRLQLCTEQLQTHLFKTTNRSSSNDHTKKEETPAAQTTR